MGAAIERERLFENLRSDLMRLKEQARSNFELDLVFALQALYELVMDEEE